MPDLLERGASSLFSTAVFRPILDGRPAERANRLASDLQSAIGLESKTTNQDIVSAAYDVLCAHYRSEYFYKNLIVNKLFVGRHRASNSVLIPEFRVHESVADCVLVNGQATAYEIKTEFDSPEKLERQLASYYRAFRRVNVVAHASDASRYLTLLDGTPTGLIAVGSRQRLSQVKEPLDNASSLDVKSMFDSLRIGEVTSILRRAVGYVPDVPNGLRYSSFLELARAIPAPVFQREMQQELKSRGIQNCRTLMLDRSSLPLSALLVQLDPNAQQQQHLLEWLASTER